MQNELLNILKKAPAVIAVLTSERTKAKVIDMAEDIEDATSAVMEASESAAADVLEIFEELLDAMGHIHTTRKLRTPEEEKRIKRVREMLGKEKTFGERIDEELDGMTAERREKVLDAITNLLD